MIQARFLFLREARAFVKTGSRLTSKREGCSTDCDEQATTLRDCGQALRCAVQVPLAKLGVYSTALEERDFCFAHENDNKNLENNTVATGNCHLAQYQLCILCFIQTLVTLTLVVKLFVTLCAATHFLADACSVEARDVFHQPAIA